MKMSETELRNPDDEGLSLIEIVVAMFILALLSVAFLPLLVQGVRQSAQTATIATATQLANARMDAERAQAQAGANCPTTRCLTSAATSPLARRPACSR